jgi:glycosyltransferase involved in cell wall biosynthesis
MPKRPFRIFLFSPYCLLRPTTNRIYDMRLCDGFAGHGNRVTVVYPFTYMKENIRSREIPGAYGLQNTVHRRRLWTPLKEHSPKLWRFLILFLAFTFSALRITLEGILLRRRTLIISRDAKSLVPAIVFRKLLAWLFPAKVIYIASEVKNNRIYKWVVKNADGVMAGVTSTREAIRKIVPLNADRFMLSLAPVPASTVHCTKLEARKEIGYNDPAPLVVYTGKLGMDVHELRYIFEAAKLVPGYNFLFTGGRPAAVEAVKKHCAALGVNNVIFTGFFNDSTYVRYYQLAADVLVSYYTAMDHLVEFNYPQKVNEYMTTGNVVVTPDFPATRDVLNEKNVIFVQPDSPKDLARGVRLAVEDRALSERLSRQALLDMRELTFEKRTFEFLEFAERL